MKFILNIVGKHLWAAIVQNWLSTVVGVITAVALGWPALADTYLVGKQPDQVHWSLFLAALGSLAWGAFSKIALNWKSLLGDLTASAPRAELVKKP